MDRRTVQGSGERHAARLVFLAFLAAYGAWCIAHPEAGWLLNAVDLAIHETGHLAFGFFGEFTMFLGGTLLQLLLPSAFVIHFLRRSDRYAAGVALWWVAQNFWNVSVYVADARSQLLPLVGGGEHDWAYLLGCLGLLAHDQAVARTVHFTGIIIFGAALWLMLLGTRGGMRGTEAEAAR